MTKFKNIFQNLVRLFKFKSGKEGQNEEDLEQIAQKEQKHFDFGTLAAATKDFHPRFKLGEGGFGPVYRGKLDDGRQIAVKKLSHRSNQGKKEFKNEANLLARVQHRNVVSLLGYCAHGVEKLLVYEYVPNESLDKLLFKSNRKEKLDWKRRFEIIGGIARGLLYLHEDSHDCIIHRDIKASNILLDDKWVPKIADFGMARLFPEDQTHVNTRLAGTNGYMAPEYVMRGHLSVKVDVFSFGVLVLEIISGQRNSSLNLNVDAQNLIDWVKQDGAGNYGNVLFFHFKPKKGKKPPYPAYKLYKKGKALEIMDPVLAPSAVPEQVSLCIQIGLLCTQVDHQLRPDMRRVLVLLSKKPGSLEEPTRPGVPSSSYNKRSGWLPPGFSLSSGTSGDLDSRTSESTFNTNTASASASAFASKSANVSSSKSDPHGKRPLQS